jgi:hypothetical protein
MVSQPGGMRGSKNSKTSCRLRTVLRCGMPRRGRGWRGEAEESTAIATTMLDKARGMESRRVRDRVLTVSNAIQAQGDSMAAREFGERVSDQYSVPL